MTRNRLAAIDRLFPDPQRGTGAPRAAISEWLEALAHAGDAVEGSRAAVQTAACLKPEVRGRKALGNIVLTGSGEWRAPDPERIFLPDADMADDPASASLVHPMLANDGATLAALETLGIEPVSPEGRFRLLVRELAEGGSEESRLEMFWTAARGIEPATAHKIIMDTGKNLCKALRVRSLSGSWKPINGVLLPGAIVPGDGNRDRDMALDTEYHGAALELLKLLGVTEKPEAGRDLSQEQWFGGFFYRCERKFVAPERQLRSYPQYLKFNATTGVGPLDVMENLSDEGCALYTKELLDIEETYDSWTMRHDVLRPIHPDLKCTSPTIEKIKQFGRIRTSEGVVPFRSALGEKPENLAALRVLLEHPKAEKIRKAFDLADLSPNLFGEPDVFGEEEPVPLLDEWPGLGGYLPEERKNDRLIRCERIHAGGVDWRCFPHGSDIYLVLDAEESRALGLVAEALRLGLHEDRIARVLRRETPGEIRARREAVGREADDAARLLRAVGEMALRSKLPASLLAMVDEHEDPLAGLRIAEAAIAVWHTDTLRQFRGHLGPLDPPRRWAGSGRAVGFVTALGFSVEWAGSRNRRRDPFLEVDGPFALPELHDYQRRVVDRTRALFRRGRRGVGNKRGMISMPTGSGKTRVAVQAVVEALRHGELAGGVLWIADRDELCEQAVEAWQQVWAARGVERERLRISRLWGNQSRPPPVGERHVVVATVQTLAARFRNRPDDYAFLADFALVVFDEAHRSIAPTFTEVMQELGMGGRRRRPGEAFLVGLTATPYRGYNEQETAWLAGRYGRVRLDAGAFRSDDPHEVVAELQQMKVLAEADQREIEGGELTLSDDEQDRMQTSPWLPQSAEDRIAGDSERTMRIVEAFGTHIARDWPALVFATSVEHAQTLAALLTGRGIAARAVSSETEPAARRRIVEEFRKGDIRALVNYRVFSEGFDAPKTRAIVVAPAGL